MASVSTTSGRISAAFNSRGTVRAKRLVRLPCMTAGVRVSDMSIETVQLPCGVGPKSLWRRSALFSRSLSPTVPLQWVKALIGLLPPPSSLWARATILSSLRFAIGRGQSSGFRTLLKRRTSAGDVQSAAPLCSQAVAGAFIRQLIACDTKRLAAVCMSTNAVCTARRFLARFVGPDEEKLTTSQSRRAQWYATQTKRSLVDVESVKHLCQEPSMRSYQQRVHLVLGFLTQMPNNGNQSSLDVLNFLPLVERIAVAVQLISQYASVERLHGIINEAFTAVLGDPLVTSGDAAVLLRALMKTNNAYRTVSKESIAAVVRLVIAGGKVGVPGVHTVDEVPVALRLGERVLSPMEMAVLCEEGGLHRESAVYRAAAAAAKEFPEPTLSVWLPKRRHSTCSGAAAGVGGVNRPATAVSTPLRNEAISMHGMRRRGSFVEATCYSVSGNGFNYTTNHSDAVLTCVRQSCTNNSEGGANVSRSQSSGKSVGISCHTAHVPPQ
ncbi:hypothetical protein TRVL_00298 [Trypanosoma vivax]|nr:hypothetical protein TRVL_00298 [Trypanosoma vivax]